MTTHDRIKLTTDDGYVEWGDNCVIVHCPCEGSDEYDSVVVEFNHSEPCPHCGRAYSAELACEVLVSIDGRLQNV